MFDPIQREIQISGGKVALNTAVDTQNGAILLYSRCAITSNPLLGIDINQVKGSNTSILNYELSRWVQHCKTDGATDAGFTITNFNQWNFNIKY